MWPDLELIGLYPLRFSEIRARNYIPVPNTTSPVLKKGISDTDFSTCLLVRTNITDRLREMRRGVKNPQNFSDVICGMAPTVFQVTPHTQGEENLAHARLEAQNADLVLRPSA